MGNKFGRKITRKLKMGNKGNTPLHPSQEGKVILWDENRSKGSSQEGNKSGNGYIWCQVKKQQMSQDVCIVRQVRMPHDCGKAHCPHFKEAA